MNTESIELYVSRSGTLNEYCTFAKPCGSLAIVLWNIKYGYIEHENVTIYVKGHYTEAFNADIDCNSEIYGNIIIIFDRDYIKSTTEWAPFINMCYALNNEYTLYQVYGERSSITFHHLIYENTGCLFLVGSINCYDCTFSNLYIEPNINNTSHGFITIHHSSMFIDCLFENITISAINDVYSVAFIDVFVYLDDGIIIMDNYSMNNVITLGYNTYFIRIVPHIKHYVVMNISNVLLFNSNPLVLSRFIYANTESSFVNSKNEISLVSSSFIGSINIVYIDVGIFSVNMNDIDIKTRQLYLNKNELYLNALHFGKDSISSIRNIEFTTLLLCNDYCLIPIGFLYNAGDCNLQNIRMKSNESGDMEYIKYIDMDLSVMHYIFSIYNDNEGRILMHNVSFLNGANYHFLYNLRGIVIIERLNLVAMKLKAMNLFINYGDLFINDSNIIGCSGVGFELYHGSIYVYNSVLSYLALIIESMYTVDDLHFDSVNISCIEYGIHIASYSICITNCIFNMYSSNGILEFASIGALESSAFKLQSTQKRMIIMDNNEFIMNNNNNNNDLNGYIEIMNPYSMHLTQNRFISSHSNESISWIYIDTSMYNHCIASNTFYGNALFIQNGSIISCKYPQIDDNNDECLISFGTPHREYTSSTLFINTNSSSSVAITLNSSSSIILDSVQFIDFCVIPIQIIGENNSISIFDAMYDSNMIFEAAIYCNILCYQIVDDNIHFIRQLIVICNNNNNNFYNNYSINSVSSWSPYRIHLTSDAVYPGGSIIINYSILDIYGNIVKNYYNDLQIKLICHPLYIDNILYIEADTHYTLNAPRITMNDVGTVFEIFTYVLNDLLLVNNLNVSIIHAPRSNQIQVAVWIIVVSIALCLTMLLIIYFVCKKSLIQQEKSLAQYIENPLVVLIGIGIYDNYFPDLAMDIDLENISRLFRYLNYKIIGHETKLQWTENEMMQFIHESAKEACEYKYDALIVIISCHGIPGSIVTTDMKTISFDRIHKAYCLPYPELRHKPRIFIYDICINQNNDSNNDSIKRDPSPDHKLVHICTESDTVQSKMNQIDGSYVLHEFGKRIIANIDQHSNGNIKCLGQIMDGINDYRQDLHKKGIKIQFNDDTRYLKLIKNEIKNDIIIKKAPKISHIAIERVYRSHSHITNPSLIQSDKASTMSATRRDKFIRTKNKNNTQKRKYRIIEMEDIEEDSQENKQDIENVIQVTDTDSSQTQTDTIKCNHITLRESDSAQL